jgi:nucleotide-binding universal stress UspA family protein
VRAAAERALLPEVQALEQAGYRVSVMIQCGDPTQTIVEVAAREAVDLVAMATHGRAGLRRLVLGSVTEAVLRELTVPVLLVHPCACAVNEQAVAVADADQQPSTTLHG